MSWSNSRSYVHSRIDTNRGTRTDDRMNKGSGCMKRMPDENFGTLCAPLLPTVFVFQFQKKRKTSKTLNCVVIYNAKEKIETVFCYCQQFNFRNIIYLLNCLLLFLPILPIKFKKLQSPWHGH